MPVAGPVGLGSAQAVKEAGDVWFIGVDSDWTVSAPDYKDVIFTSVLKNMDMAVFDTVKMVIEDGFDGFGGDTYVGTLANDGVGVGVIADGTISGDVESAMDDIRQGIIDGTINTGWADYLSSLN